MKLMVGFTTSGYKNCFNPVSRLLASSVKPQSDTGGSQFYAAFRK